jgi:formylglycine-generating enzyme required for sulfatase activity
MSMKFDVFISYPHANKATADAVCAALEADGVRCWVAPRDVPPGSEWAAALVEAIDRCRLMVLVFSSHSNQSKQVFREIQRAFDREAPVIPFRVEDVNPEKSLAYYMGSVHWLDAFTPPLEQHLQRLVTSVKAILRTRKEVDGDSEPRNRSDVEITRDGSIPGRPGNHDPAFANNERVANDVARETGNQTRKAWRPPLRAILIASVLCLAGFGSLGVWTAIKLRTPAPADSKNDSATVSSGLSTPLTSEGERALEPGNFFKECDKCPEMVVAPAGKFTMGSPIGEPGRNVDEGPQHSVTFARRFAAGKFAVTFDEWDACVADGGCNGYRPNSSGWGRGKWPVINVSWADAKAYVAWLAETTGKPYRLLTEAEREYVTRAGTTTPFWWGASISTNQANYNGSPFGQGAKGQDRGHTVTVDSFEPNPWGLYQVHGNIYEWVEDCWIASYEGAPNDGSAQINGDCSYRAIRGGSWDYDPEFLRSASRLGWLAETRDIWLGFRVGRTLPPR